jgi:hypothetical protein
LFSSFGFLSSKFVLGSVFFFDSDLSFAPYPFK